MEIPLKISVVIPMFNAEGTIQVPLRSLCAQTLPPDLLELVLVDDGSTDASVSRAERLLEGVSFRWRLLRKARGGVSLARNRGIAEARGEYVFFLDADDSLPRDFLETVLEGLESKRADLAWIWKITNPAEAPASNRHPMGLHHEGMKCLEAFLREPKNAQIMVRRSFLDATGIRYTEGLAYGEDFDLFVRLLLEARLVHVEDRTFYIYRKHVLQVTRTINRVAARQATDRTFRRLSLHLEERAVPEGVLLEMRRHAAKARINLLREVRRAGMTELFEQLIGNPETEEAIRFAGQGLLPVKWQLRAAMLDLARLMKG
ncbi:MAG: glycosyltransferase family 2 protein [Synergistales bacterium]